MISLSPRITEGDLDIDTLRSVFRLAGDDIHVTHIPPSSPAKSVVGRSPSERFHQAPTPSIGDYFLNYLVAKRKKQSVHNRFLSGSDVDNETMLIIATFSEVAEVGDGPSRGGMGGG